MCRTSGKVVTNRLTSEAADAEDPPMPSARTALRGLSASAVLAVAAVLVPATGASAATAPLSATDQAVADRLAIRSTARALGPDLAGIVTDAATGQVLWARTPNEIQIPASNTKIITAANALEAFGPTYRFTTQVVTGPTPSQVVLVGSGDPSLKSVHLNRMARTVAAAVQAQGLRKVRVQVDDSLFPAPTLATGWQSAYVTRDVSHVRALVVDQHRRWDTSLDAGQVFAAKLRKWGLKVGSVTRAVRPEGATVLAQSQGAALGAQVAAMLQESDNDVAEGLHRLVAIKTGFEPSWDGARQAQVAGLAALGIPLTSTMYDGSGLSRKDRLSPATLAAVLAAVMDGRHPNLVGLQHGSFAVAGVSGTLAPAYKRYVTNPTRCAAGLIEAKTGSLSGVISLSGFARGADGNVKIFSFLLNRVPSTLTTRRAVDRLAATVTGCW
jgi:D-alanyl-D-alanine carboxypeptidase/D-alanyl-D-alanine-endopeptidase (penicillin-binding protein 4)